MLQTPLPGKQFSPPALGMSASVASFYAQAAAHHVTWLSSMQCTHTGLTHVLAPSPDGIDAAGINNGYVSGNWSGYQIANTVQYTQAGWTIPTVVKPNPGYSANYYSSTWTGIGGGFNASATAPLIQAGSSQHLLSTGPQYYFWYEIVGGPTTTRDANGNPSEVKIPLAAVPGHASGSVTFWTPLTSNPLVGTVTFGLCDFTSGQPCATIVVNAKYTPQPGNSTEWIVEAPSGSFGALPLADFDHVNFVNAVWTRKYVVGSTNTGYTIAQGVSPTQIYMTQNAFNRNQLIAAPDLLNSDGASFTDFYMQPSNGN